MSVWKWNRRCVVAQPSNWETAAFLAMPRDLKRVLRMTRPTPGMFANAGQCRRETCRQPARGSLGLDGGRSGPSCAKVLNHLDQFHGAATLGTVTCEGDDVTWWATPEWTTPDGGWATAGLRIVT